MNKLYKVIRESDAAAWTLTIAGIGLIVLIALIKKKNGYKSRTKLPKQSITNIEPEVNYFRGSMRATKQGG